MTPLLTQPKIICSNALCLFYSLVLLLILNPDVSPHYYQYYIERSTTLPSIAVQQLRPLTPGKIIYHDNQSNEVLFDGWSFPETDYRWSNGNKNQILFSFPGSAQLKGKITLDAFYLHQQHVLITLNGVDIFDYASDQVTENLIIHFNPDNILPEEINRLAFQFPDAKYPGNGDQRKLAMALKSIIIE